MPKTMKLAEDEDASKKKKTAQKGRSALRVDLQTGGSSAGTQTGGLLIP